VIGTVEGGRARDKIPSVGTLKSSNLLGHSKLPLRINNIAIGGRLRKGDDGAWRLIKQRWEVVKDTDDKCSDTVERASDEAQTKSRKLIDSWEEWASEKKGRDSLKVASWETECDEETGPQQRYPLHSIKHGYVTKVADTRWIGIWYGYVSDTP
jgi:hypothetical protein